jgi:hypothetical protein
MPLSDESAGILWKSTGSINGILDSLSESALSSVFSLLALVGLFLSGFGGSSPPEAKLGID